MHASFSDKHTWNRNKVWEFEIYQKSKYCFRNLGLRVGWGQGKLFQVLRLFAIWFVLMLEHNTFVHCIVFVSQNESNWPQECRTACVIFVFYLFFVFVFWIVLYLYHRMNKIGLKNAGVRVQLQAAASPDLAYLLFTSYFPPPDLKSPNYFEKLKSFAFHIIPPAHLPIIWKAWIVGFITKSLTF